MSATIADDSSIVQTFDTQDMQILKGGSVAGISERMILLPDSLKLGTATPQSATVRLIGEAGTLHGAVTVILVPSAKKTEPWKALAKYPSSPNEVLEIVRALQNGTEAGPVVFANRYDGIDLPGDACRILVMSGLPQGESEYDQFISTILSGGNNRNTRLAQRIEQGIGRGARGSGDHCVVILLGAELNAWIAKKGHRRFLTEGTRAQLEMGLEVSESITSSSEYVETAMKCLSRDRDWARYHASFLANVAGDADADKQSFEEALSERAAFRLVGQGHYPKAITKLKKTAEGARDKVSRGWYFQHAARTAELMGDAEASRELQETAFSANGLVARPRGGATYVPIAAPDEQASAIARQVTEYAPRRAILGQLDEIAGFLSAESSANQFEQAFEELGELLGLGSERPYKKFGRGPDLLWILPTGDNWVIEAKSRREPSKAFRKEHLGQLLVAGEWFRENYKHSKFKLISLHPNSVATKQTNTDNVWVLTFDRLQRLLGDLRSLLRDTADSEVGDARLPSACAELLAKSSVAVDRLSVSYLQRFTTE
jgi:hypothetical protein